MCILWNLSHLNLSCDFITTQCCGIITTCILNYFLCLDISGSTFAQFLRSLSERSVCGPGIRRRAGQIPEGKAMSASLKIRFLRYMYRYSKRDDDFFYSQVTQLKVKVRHLSPFTLIVLIRQLKCSWYNFFPIAIDTEFICNLPVDISLITVFLSEVYS